MKPLNFLLVLAGLIFFPEAYGQIPSYQVGEGVVIDRNSKINFAGHDEDNFYVVRTEKAKRNNVGFLESYSRNTLKKVMSVPIKVPKFDGDEFTVNEILFGEKGFLIFYSYYNKRDDLMHLMITNYDTAGKPSTLAVELMTAQGINETAAGKFYIFQNKFAKNIIVVHTKPKKASMLSKEESIESKVHILMLDKTLKIVYDKELDYNFKAGDLSDIYLDEYGNFYALIDVFGTGMTGKETIRLAVYNKSIDKLTSINIPGNVPSKNKKKIYLRPNRHFYEDPSSNLYIINPYNNLEGDFDTYGLYMAKYDKKNQALAEERLIPWTKSDDPEEKIKKDKDINLRFYGIESIQFFPDNSFKVLLERNYLIETDMNEVYNSEQMLEVRLDPSFNITSMVFIPRYGIFVDNKYDYSSCLTLSTAGDSYFMFNELPSNLQIDEQKKIHHTHSKESGVVPCIAAISSSGKAERTVFITQVKGAKFNLLQCRNFYEIGKDELISLIDVAGRTNFIKIYLKK